MHVPATAVFLACVRLTLIASSVTAWVESNSDACSVPEITSQEMTVFTKMSMPFHTPKTPIAIIMVGGPGSGKSASLELFDRLGEEACASVFTLGRAAVSHLGWLCSESAICCLHGKQSNAR